MSQGVGRSEAALLALLLSPVAYLVAQAVQPAGAAAVWPVLVAGVAGVAAWGGARSRQEQAGRLPLAVVAGAGGLAGALSHAGLALPGEALGPALGRAAVTSSAAAAGAWLVAHRLAAGLRRAAHAGHGSGGTPATRLLLGLGCLALASAGGIQWGGAPAGEVAGSGLAVLAYTALALLFLQRRQRLALAADWARGGRSAPADVFAGWRAVHLALVGALLAVVAFWLLPPLEPARTAAEETSPRAVERIRAFVGDSLLTRDDVQRPGGMVAGESMRGGDPASTEDDRRTITVRPFLDWLLTPGTGMDEAAPAPGDEGEPVRWTVTPQLLVLLGLLLGVALLVYRRRRRRSGSPAELRPGVVAWWASLRALLAAVRRLGLGQRAPGAGPAAAITVAQEDEGPAPVRRWLRPSSPREQVRYDYRRVLEAAGRRGVPREPAMSPVEYTRVLAGALPESRAAVDELTGAFVEARYSHHRIAADTARRTKEASRELRRALKNRETATPR